MQTDVNYNPDVLTCIANLSSDEVFTPPLLVNQILDHLPSSIWRNKNITFLDPFTKSGVFLREIAKRLIVGLADAIPDMQKRLNHIYTKQLYGIAITELTALLSRRSLYCTKKANGKYSVCTTFENEEGNILFGKVQHKWKDGKCVFCGASQEVYERDEVLETHAYQFIHTANPERIFNMKFDVIVGNPPYQLNDGGGTGSSARPIYNLFIEQAKKLNPRFLSMIIPSRWYSGGKGLDDFRNNMLNDRHIRKLIDFADSRDCFPGVDIAGGVCYFLWDRDNAGLCDVTTYRKGIASTSTRYLNEFETFVRDNIAVEIIHKIKKTTTCFLDVALSSRMPFGLASNVKPESKGELELITSTGTGKFPKEKVKGGVDLISKWKVLLSKASFDHGGQPDKDGKRKIFSRVEVIGPNTICTESYLIVGCFETEEEAANMTSFLKSKFCRFLVSTILLTQNITKGKFVFVPFMDMKKTWSDSKLYIHFNLTENEIAFIENNIRSYD